MLIPCNSFEAKVFTCGLKLPRKHTVDKASTNTKRIKQHKMLDLSAKFTKLATAPGIDESLCPRCKLIDFAAIFERAGDELNGTIIANIGLLPPRTFRL